MRKMLIVSTAIVLASATYAQQKEGRVVYERTMQMQIQFEGINGTGPQSLPRSRKDKFEVMFANNQSLRRTIADDTPDEEVQEGGMRIMTIAAGADDIVFYNLGNGKITEQREFAGKKYLVADSVRKLNWKLTGETKTILNYPCQKAVSQRIGQRRMMSMENGQTISKAIADTSNITVWFTGSIPVSAGPDYQGQLPGLILEISLNDGKTVYQALEVSQKVDADDIREPKSGKKVTVDEFNRERDKLMEEMQKNGRGRTIRINS